MLDRLEVARRRSARHRGQGLRRGAQALRAVGRARRQYAAAWSEERFRVHGVTYLASERTTTEHFVAFLPLLTSNTVELLDHGQLRHELCGLERRAGRSGRDAVSHRVGGHDDARPAWRGPACWRRRSRRGIRVCSANLRDTPRARTSTSASSSCSGAATTSANRAIRAVLEGHGEATTTVRELRRSRWGPLRAVAKANRVARRVRHRGRRSL